MEGLGLGFSFGFRDAVHPKPYTDFTAFGGLVGLGPYESEAEAL